MSVTTVRCTCGKVQLELRGAPIIVSECHCHSCREAARRIGQLPGAPAVTEDNGGTHFVLYRKDRVSITSRFEQLRNFRPGSERQTPRGNGGSVTTPELR